MAAILTPTKKRVPTEAPRQDTLSTIRQEMDDLLGRFWSGRETSWFGKVFSPDVDLSETGNAYQLRMDIPGVQASDIDVQVHGNQVTISGQRQEEKEEKGKTFHRVERHSGAFSRSLTLPCKVSESEVVAEYEQGVLTVVLPKCEEAQSKKITVKG